MESLASLTVTPAENSAGPAVTIQQLLIDKIYTSPHQMRKHFAEEPLQELAESMKQQGLIQPVTVRQVGQAYELIAGERRLRAAKLLAWETIQAIVLEYRNDENVALIGLIENLQREDLNPLEEARGFKQLTEPPYNMTQEAIAQRVGKQKSTVSRALALFDLPPEIQDMLPRGNISERHCRLLAQVPQRTQQIELAVQAEREAWSVKELERRVNELLGKHALETGDYKESPAKDPYAGPPSRRKMDKVKEEDPLTDLWLQLVYTPEVAAPGTWNVRYEGSGQWNFEVWAASEDPRKSLGTFFTRLGQALEGSVSENLSAQGDPPKNPKPSA